MKHSCIEDPADLCSVNIAGLDICDARPDDFVLFDNVAYINAADNTLSLDAFSKFAILRELELPVNGVSSINLTHKMFRQLEMLDLSYNKMTSDDVLQLGYLRNLKVLYLSGNGLSSLPENMAGFYATKNGFKKRRFPKLEILCLDDNQLNNYTAFAPLAGLKHLKHLNLETNEISAVPQLEPKTIKHDNVKESTEDVPEEESNTAKKEELQDESVADFSFGELKIANMDALDITKLSGTRSAHEVDSDGEVVTDSEDEVEQEDSPSIPFPQLRFLTLAHNYLTEEEDLLPIAAWPNLTQVHIYDNPLTNETSGDPPMLKKFLTDRLGIDLIRKKPIVMKPIKEFPVAKNHRKVSSLVPPVPKCDVEKLLSLEASNGNQGFLNSPAGKSPLPPIGQYNADGSMNGRDSSNPGDSIKARDSTNTGPTASDEKQAHSSAFFMTQIDDIAEQISAAMQPTTTNLRTPGPVVDNKVSEKVIQVSAQQQNVFRGYEELLIEDEVEKLIQTPTDLHNTVKALNYALKHPVVNNYTMRLEKSQKPFVSYKRSDMRSYKRPQTKAEKLNNVMETVKGMDTVIEASLERALTDKQLANKYPQAAKLLSEIQRKYANVHSSTLGHSDAVRNALRKPNSERPHTGMEYMVDKQTSVTELIRPATNL